MYGIVITIFFTFVNMASDTVSPSGVTFRIRMTNHISHIFSHILWDISKMLAVFTLNHDGVRIVVVLWFWHQHTIKITNVCFQISAIVDTGNIQYQQAVGIDTAEICATLPLFWHRPIVVVWMIQHFMIRVIITYKFSLSQYFGKNGLSFQVLHPISFIFYFLLLLLSNSLIPVVLPLKKVNGSDGNDNDCNNCSHSSLF